MRLLRSGTEASAAVSLAACAVLSLAACAPRASPPTLFRGMAVFGHEVRAFTPCGSGESMWAIDSSGMLWDLHQEFRASAETPAELFAVIEGRAAPTPASGLGAEYAGTIVVENVLYMAPEGFGCDMDWNAFQYRVSGNEPFWTIVVTFDSIVSRPLGEPERTWALLDSQADDGALRYAAGLPDQDTVSVTVERRACRDSMSGAFFGFTAIIRIGTDERSGCTLLGSPSAFPRGRGSP